MDALQKEKVYTLDDIYALPDGERAELIDGKLYYMSPPSRTHQRILLSLSRKFERETMEEYFFGEDIPVGIYESFSVRIP